MIRLLLFLLTAGHCVAQGALEKRLADIIAGLANQGTSAGKKDALLAEAASLGQSAYYILMELAKGANATEAKLWEEHKQNTKNGASDSIARSQAAGLMASARTVATYLALAYTGSEAQLSWLVRYRPYPAWVEIDESNEPLEDLVLDLHRRLERRLGRKLKDTSGYLAPAAGSSGEITADVIVCGDLAAMREIYQAATSKSPQEAEKTGDTLFAAGRCINVKIGDRLRLIEQAPDPKMLWRAELLSGQYRGRKVWTVIDFVRPVISMFTK